MTKRRRKDIAALPVGVSRAENGKGWKADVLERKGFVLLGVYPTIRAAVAARAKYWKAKERAA
jgi:hypothetical protein